MNHEIKTITKAATYNILIEFIIQVDENTDNKNKRSYNVCVIISNWGGGALEESGCLSGMEYIFCKASLQIRCYMFIKMSYFAALMIVFISWFIRRLFSHFFSYNLCDRMYLIVCALSLLSFYHFTKLHIDVIESGALCFKNLLVVLIKLLKFIENYKCNYFAFY